MNLSFLTNIVVYIRKTLPLTTPSQPERKPQRDHFGNIFTIPHHYDPPPKSSKDTEKKVKAILSRLQHYGITNLTEGNVEYALQTRTSQGDPETAFRLLMMLEDTYEGIIRPYNSGTRLLGAVNREAVTCYLDALLFAMFAKLDSFEAILYENFEDAKRRKLAGLLRLWVNMLRTGNLITIDITEHIQDAMVECGWADAGRCMQQDPSEAFTFITGQLELPMLTLKMDMFHTGKEDPQDDHKFVNERLLEVAILDEPTEGQDVICLEDCLEHYFNNRIEVKRHLEQQQRRNTLKSAPMGKIEKESGLHVEVAELELEGPETPIVQTPSVLTPVFEKQLRPTIGRKRADSIFSQRRVQLAGVDPETLNQHTNSNDDEPNTTQDVKGRKLSTRTEVLMPAWQFFKLLPWYTNNMPTSDAQVAAHFSKKRPVLGICLKRYSYTNTGQARRLDTYVDIPLEIAVPNFVSDDNMQEEGPVGGNFRLVLQSVVCHRGVSVHSGHYVCLCRGRTPAGQPNSRSRRESTDTTDDTQEDPWMRFDDLASERITPVDIHEALKRETPYLLFYQVLPIGEDGNELPSYTEATSRSQSDAAPLEKPYHLEEAAEGGERLEHVLSEPTLSLPNSTMNRPSIEIDRVDFGSTTERNSLDIGTLLSEDQPSRGRTHDEPRRKSIAFDSSTSTGSNSVPSTPSEEKGNAFLNVANKLSVASSRRGSGNKGAKPDAGKTKPRPRSTGPGVDTSGNRFSLNMSKLTARMGNNNNNNSKGDLSSSSGNGASVEDGRPPVIQPSEHVARELAGQKDAAVLPASSVNASKESVAAAAMKPAPSKSKKGAKRKSGRQDDRDCVLM
ncbi:hypothetical protein LTR37_005611 [Vermiconidia calcicola]|uniref:Uncharacterized protein n=1 Tax=Vermiconidia calcicola TaxID=1690605 RepID=A0ACC3NKQ0_9PEZI|nr:hypothetical protein LTR37_005611 [Vermiconidia calcicola]